MGYDQDLLTTSVRKILPSFLCQNEIDPRFHHNKPITIALLSQSTEQFQSFSIIIERNMSQHLQELVPNAEIVSKQQALIVNTAAAVGLQNVLQSNLGPTGTLKLLVGGTSTQLKLTKDGCTLLKEMQIQHPVAALIARTATAQDDITGDGTTSTVLLIGEILKQCAVYTTNSNYSTTNASGNSNTIHPRIITDGLDTARDAALEFLKTKFALDQSKSSISSVPVLQNRDLLLSVARTSLATKLDAQLVTKVCCSTRPLFYRLSR
jgi:T-complex protein 1 subunit zeta